MDMLGEKGLLNEISTYIQKTTRWLPITASLLVDITLHQEHYQLQQAEATELAQALCVKKNHNATEDQELLSRTALNVKTHKQSETVGYINISFL